MRVLLIEDDSATAQSIELMLQSEGFNVYTTEFGEEGVDLGKLYDYDIILLDINLPDMSGYEVLKTLRVSKVQTPILILSGLAGIDDKVRGLGFGADDYMTKPFGVRELLARVRTLTRRGESKPDEIARYVIGDATIDLKGFQVVRGGKATPLTAMEAKIIRYLIAHRNDVVTREKLLDEIWGYDVYPTTRTVDNLILKLRKKIEKNHNTPRVLLTVYGAGYKFTG